LLVAGAVGGEAQTREALVRRAEPPLRQAGTQTAPRERLGDFYLYPLPERTTIANNQTKQVSFLDVHHVAATRAYEFRNGWLGTSDQPRSARSVLRFSTSSGQGLGDALPAGTVRVYQRDQRGNAQFVGESPIGHTPMGSEVGLTTGDAFDVRVRPVLERRDRISDDRWRTSMRYTLTNARDTPVTVDLVQAGLVGDTRVIEESAPSARRSADELVWHVPIPANGEASVTATFETRY
jgi:hypothetical protein